MDVSPKLLRYAIRAADCGSITAAAATLGVETSAVSRGIRQLEDHIGVSLFQRGARGSMLTRAGAAYLEQAREALDALERATGAARAAGEGKSGSLRIGFVWSFLHGPVVRLLAGLRASRPAVQLQLVEGGPDDLIARLHRGELDIVLTAIEPPSYTPTRGIGALNRLPLWVERLVAAVPHAEARAALQWTDLIGRDLLCREIDDAERYAAFVAGSGGPQLRFVRHDCSQEGILGIVAAGVGWTVVPDSLALSYPGVAYVPIDEPQAAVTVEVLWKPRTDNPVLRRFLALARKENRTGTFT